MSILFPAFMAGTGGARELNIVVSAHRTLNVPSPDILNMDGSVADGTSGYLQLAEVDMENRVIILGEEIRTVLIGIEIRTVSVASENRTVQV